MKQGRGFNFFRFSRFSGFGRWDRDRGKKNGGRLKRGACAKTSRDLHAWEGNWAGVVWAAFLLLFFSTIFNGQK